MPAASAGSSPQAFSPPRSPERVDAALGMARAAYLALPVPTGESTRPHRSWGKRVAKTVLAPLDCAAGFAMVETGLRLIREGRFPALHQAVSVAESGFAVPAAENGFSAYERAAFAAGAELPASTVYFQGARPEVHMQVFMKLKGELLTGSSRRDAFFCWPAEYAFLGLIARPRIGYAKDLPPVDPFSFEPSWDDLACTVYAPDKIK